MTKNKSELTRDEKIKGFGTLIVLLVFFVIIFRSCTGCGNNNTDTKPDSFSEVDAYVWAQTFVEKKLKAPSSAEFCSIYDGTHISQYSDTVYFVSGCLDAQNSFGAMIRSKYSCLIIYVPHLDIVRAEDVKVY